MAIPDGVNIEFGGIHVNPASSYRPMHSGRGYEHGWYGPAHIRKHEGNEVLESVHQWYDLSPLPILRC